MPIVHKWPTHAYVPGTNARHPEGTFDVLRDSARPDMEPEALAKSEAFVYGLKYLDKGYFWEAHELLEPIWMALPLNSPERKFVQGLIQIANAQLKWRMNRPRATLRLCLIARNLLTATEQTRSMGADVEPFLSSLDLLQAQANRHYKS